MIKRRKTALIISAVAIGIFLFIFIPIIGGSAHMVLDAVGFREEAKIELRNPITIEGDFCERLIVYRVWAVRELVLEFDGEVQSAKAYYVKDGFRSILSEAHNTARAVFGDTYQDSDGNTVFNPIDLSNQLDYDTEQYLSDEDIGAWLEIEVRTSSAVTMTVQIVENEKS